MKGIQASRLDRTTTTQQLEPVDDTHTHVSLSLSHMGPIYTANTLTRPRHMRLFIAISAAAAAWCSANSTNAYGSLPGWNQIQT